MIEIGKVINSTPGTIQILLNSIEVFDQNKSEIKVSKYLAIEDGNDLYICLLYTSIDKIKELLKTINAAMRREHKKRRTERER